MSNLVRAFPSVQFIVASHSPFIITSVRDSKVYALRYTELKTSNGDGKSSVSVEEINLISKARSADKILDEVLGVSVTIPKWTEHDLDLITRKFERAALSRKAISDLRAELQAAGLSEFFRKQLEGLPMIMLAKGDDRKFSGKEKSNGRKICWSR